MAKLLHNTSLFIGKTFIFLSKKIYQSPQQKRTVPWIKIKGDKTLRLDYNLNEYSIVFDLGGYEGQWASDIFSRYGCKIFVFEPITKLANNIKNRFLKNDKITIHNFGLSKENQNTRISLEKDGSSIFKKGSNMADIKLIKAASFLQEKRIEKIDLMKINIEGSEYDLLEHLITTGYVKKISNIQVQFHDFMPDAKERMIKIQNELQKTHYSTYQYPFVWENWKAKSD